MPEEGVELQHESKILTTDEIVKIAKIFVSQGVTKIRLTGGEPTVRKDIVEIVERLNKLEGLKELCITSNGIALHRKLPQLAKNGLTSVNLSLDTLVEGKFTLITRRNGLKMVLKSLETALQLGIPKVKLNCVIVKNLNDDEILNFVKLSKYYPVEVRFIEYMPFDGNKWELEKVISFKEIMSRIQKEYPDVESIDHKYGETSKIFKIPGFQGQIGFISSMTDDFCSDCTRLRITSDGNLKVCLFGNDEVSIRDLLRSQKCDDEILQVIGKAVKNKKEKHAGLDELSTMKNRPMILIGG
jgi:cyclic pyranopterin phosphate synthase